MREIVLITGRMGKGKTTLALHRARRIFPDKGVLVFDPGANFDGCGGRIVSTHRQAMEAIAEGEDLVIFRPFEVEEGFSDFARTCWYCRRVAVVIDEASFLQSPQWIHPDLDRLVRLGREQQISIYATQHRLADTHGLLTTLATELVFFEVHHKRELERIEDHAGEVVREAMATIRGFDFLAYQVETGGWHVNRDPKSWFEPVKKPRTVPGSPNPRPWELPDGDFEGGGRALPLPLPA